MHADRCGNTHRQKCCAKGSRKVIKIQENLYGDTTKVYPEMYDCTSNNWSHWNSNENLKEKFGNCTRKKTIVSLKKKAIHEKSHIIRKVL